MRTVKVNNFTGVSWVTTFNLWICDSTHTDTCYYVITQCKPTDRQVRKFKKQAKKYFRHGTREQQREFDQARDLNYALPI